MRWGGSVGRTVTRVIRVAVRAIRRFFFLDTHNNNLNLDYYATRPAIRSDSILLFPLFFCLSFCFVLLVDAVRNHRCGASTEVDFQGAKVLPLAMEIITTTSVSTESLSRKKRNDGAADRKRFLLAHHGPIVLRI